MAPLYLSMDISKRLDPGSRGSRGLARIIEGLPKSVRQRQRSCLFGRDLRSLWQTDFATPDDAVYDWMCFVLRLEVVS